MPGLAPLAAIGPVVQLGPHSVELHGRTLRDECAIEAQICFLRGDVVRLAYEALGVLPEAVRKSAALEIVKLIRFGYSGATNADASRWLSSFEGRLFSVWLSIRLLQDDRKNCFYLFQWRPTLIDFSFFLG